VPDVVVFVNESGGWPGARASGASSQSAARESPCGAAGAALIITKD